MMFRFDAKTGSYFAPDPKIPTERNEYAKTSYDR